MILDSGICTVYRSVNTAPPGGKPSFEETPVFQSWFGDLNFETAQARPTEGREEIRTDRRIRINQLRTIANRDRVDLGMWGQQATSYRVTRAYHGTDDESGQPITDLNLEVYAP